MTDPLLDVLGLTVAFGEHVVLRDVSFAVPAGQFLCVLGPSGGGKTTLIKTIAGLEHAASGRILLAGQELRGPGQDRAFVFQDYGLLPWRTVVGNVEFALEIQGRSREERRSRAREEIARTGLAGFESHYPHQISGGMRQRVGLARAFTKDPKILLMDEPFAAVDMQTRERLGDELLQLWNSVRTTVIFVTHMIDEALYLGDRIILLRDAGIRLDLQVDLPRPRYESDVRAMAHFGELRHVVREALR